MKDFIESAVVAIGTLFLICVVVLGLGFISYKGYEFYAPRYRAVENKVFKESEQYNDGMVRDLENLQLEYISADQAHKDVMKAIILHRFSVYDENRLPYNLRSFYIQLREGKL